MGLDPRDCRLDVAFLLGDDAVPDNVNWDWSVRDVTCVWLGFIDASFNPCQQDTYETCDDEIISNTTILQNSNDVTPSYIPTVVHEIEDYVTAKVCPIGTNIVGGANEVDVVARNIVINVQDKPDVDIAVAKQNIVIARKSNNSVTAKRKNNSV